MKVNTTLGTMHFAHLFCISNTCATWTGHRLLALSGIILSDATLLGLVEAGCRTRPDVWTLGTEVVVALPAAAANQLAEYLLREPVARQPLLLVADQFLTSECFWVRSGAGPARTKASTSRAVRAS